MTDHSRAWQSMPVLESGSSLVPRLFWNVNIYRAESLVSFLCKHDVSKIGPNKKATFCAFFNQLCFNARCVCYSTPDSYIRVVSCPLPSLIFLFWSWVCTRTIKSSLPPLYLWRFHVTKNTRLSTPAQLQCSRSGAWEPGNEVSLAEYWSRSQTLSETSSLELGVLYW